MAHERPAHELLVLDRRRSCLPRHLADGGVGNFGIVRRAGELGGKLRVGVFIVRQIHVDQPLKLPQRLDRLVPAAVVHDRHGQLRRERGHDGRQKLRRRDEVDVLHALVNEAQKHVPELRRCERASRAAIRNFVVLAEAAAQRAARKKHRAAAVAPGDDRLFPVMRGGARREDRPRHPAKSAPGARAIDPAGARAQAAVFVTQHGTLPFSAQYTANAPALQSPGGVVH